MYEFNELSELILAMLRSINPYEEIDEDTELINSGVLSSLEIFVFINDAEQKFNIVINEEDLSLDSFSTITTIRELLEKYLVV